jgi:hypothetical protein
MHFAETVEANAQPFFDVRLKGDPMLRISRVLLAITISGALSTQLFLATASNSAPSLNSEIELHEQLPRGGTPGSPIDVESNYSLLIEKFFDPAPALWGGAYVDGDTLVVLAVNLSVLEASRLLSDAGITRGITVAKGQRSIAELDELTEKAVALGAKTLVSAGPMYARQQVVVGLTSDDDVIRRRLAEIDSAAYSAYLTAPPSSASRYYDTTSFRGGNQIVLTGSSANSVCSSAFAWNDPDGTNDFMVTAAHCYWSDSNTRPQVKRVVNSSPETWLPIGTVGWSSGNNSGTTSTRRGDVATYKLTAGNASTNKIYVGQCNTTASRTITGQFYLPEGWTGTTLFTSGTGCSQGNGTGEVNLDWISLVNQTEVYTNFTPNQVFNKLTVGENQSTCIGHGDSGGAVYLQRANGTAYAIGVISGTNNRGGGWTNCRSFYTPIGLVTQDFGGSLKVAP